MKRLLILAMIPGLSSCSEQKVDRDTPQSHAQGGRPLEPVADVAPLPDLVQECAENLDKMIAIPISVDTAVGVQESCEAAMRIAPRACQAFVAAGAEAGRRAELRFVKSGSRDEDYLRSVKGAMDAKKDCEG